MGRRLRILALSLLMVGYVGVYKAEAAWRAHTCRYSGGDGFSTTEVRDTIRCGVRKWMVSGGVTKALSVASCESGFDPYAYYNGNAGVYQHRLTYWPARVASYNRAVRRALKVKTNVYNARANTLVAIRYAHLYGWNAWSCA